MEDLTKDEGVEDQAGQLRKKLGIPELDPDALPSANLNKYLHLNFNRSSSNLMEWWQNVRRNEQIVAIQ